MASPAERDALIAEFCSFTDGASPQTAEKFLAQNDWNTEAAIAMYYAASEEADEPMQDVPEGESEPQVLPGGGRTLGGGPPPPDYALPSSTTQPSSSRQTQPQRGGLRTLRDLQSQSSSQGPAHGHDDDDSEDENTDFFAGGEKSGLAVQNPGQGRGPSDPRDQINRILERARRNVARPGGDEEERSPSHFRGAGQTLGGDDAPSRIIPDPNASVPAPAARVQRVLHLWRDGFSVDDGRLYRYDDPANARTLEMINSGHAPLDILDVEHGQEVDVEVHPHKDEDYVQPKKKYKPFSGEGQRLGSPTPGPLSSSAATSSTTASTSTAAAASSTPAPPTVDVDASLPTLTLQIRLGDGTRLQSRFNTSHTIGDVYAFVDRASPASAQRPYALMTTFPSKELTDKGAALGDMAEFKRGGVVVQKWK